MRTASVVIPAHNEARGIRRCLSALLDSARPGEFEIVVVANGCIDETASPQARAYLSVWRDLPVFRTDTRAHCA